MIGIIIAIVVASILLLALSVVLAVDLMYPKFLGKRGDGDIRIFYASIYDDLEAEEIVINGKKDTTLKGFIYKAKNMKTFENLIVISHGIGAGHFYLRPLIRKLCHDGYIVLAYDQYASGISQGKRILSLTRASLDLDRVLHYIDSRRDLDRYDIYLWGHSVGGYAVGAALCFNNPRIKKIINVSGFDIECNFVTGFVKGAKIIEYAFYLRNIFRNGKYGTYSFIRGLKKNKNTKVLYIGGEADLLVTPKASSLRFKKYESDKVEIDILPERGHSPYVTLECEKAQGPIFKDFGLLGGGENVPYSPWIDHEKYAQVDEDVYSKMLDFYNN